MRGEISKIVLAWALTALPGFAGDITVHGDFKVVSNLTARSFSVTNAHVGSLAVEGAATFGGMISGDGAGITNMDLSAYAGTNLVWDVAGRRLNVSAPVDTNGVISVLVSVPGLVVCSNGQYLAASDQVTQADITNAVLSAWQSLDTDAADDLTTSHPAAGDLDMGGKAVSNLRTAQNDGDAVSIACIRQILRGLQPQGNLSMGAYTNGAPESFTLTFD